MGKRMGPNNQPPGIIVKLVSRLNKEFLRTSFNKTHDWVCEWVLDTGNVATFGGGEDDHEGQRLQSACEFVAANYSSS